MHTLDVSPGELAAVVDFTNHTELRAATEFVAVSGDDCLLCGRLDSTQAHHITQHFYSKTHRLRSAQYRACMQCLLIHEQSTHEVPQGGASHREVVLIYLGHRLARTDLIVSGMREYNRAAVNYLLRRTTASDLMRVFSLIEGREHSSSRGLCSICLERPSTVLFESCKHLCACQTCAARLKVADRTDEEAAESHGPDKLACPICRRSSEVSSVYIV